MAIPTPTEENKMKRILNSRGRLPYLVVSTSTGFSKRPPYLNTWEETACTEATQELESKRVDLATSQLRYERKALRALADTEPER